MLLRTSGEHAVLCFANFQRYRGVLRAVLEEGFSVVGLALTLVKGFPCPNAGLCAKTFRKLAVDFPSLKHRVLRYISDGDSESVGEDEVVIEAVLKNFRNIG